MPNPTFKTVRELLSVPERWTQGAMSLDVKGRPAVRRADAVCWCLAGAVRQVYPDDVQYAKVCDKLEQAVGRLDRWNDYDQRTHAEVLALVTEVGV